MTSTFLNYWRCPEEHAKFDVTQDLGTTPRFFRFGNKITGFGRVALPAGDHQDDHQPDVSSLAHVGRNEVTLPFDANEILENLRKERYVAKPGSGSLVGKLIRNAYYVARPFLSVNVRKHFQRFHLRDRKQIQFPSWPIDKTADSLCVELMSLAVKANDNRPIPFVWFWPDGYQGCVLMTHDVEHEPGRAFCGDLMDLNERHGIRSSFQVVPEERYEVSDAFLESIRTRGFEVNVHDLNHDGHLFTTHEQFLERVKKINGYARKWRAEGFRAGGMYRNAEWNEAFQFSYDMSFPTAAHLEPQIGGSCSVMPYFLGELVELPLTTTQDYSLFHILDQYSIDLWKEELEFINSMNGLATFIVHPDYVIERRARSVYESLLKYLSEFCSEKKFWQPLPRDVAQWWRDRSRMRVERCGESWKVAGPCSERARVAFAQVENGQLTYSVESTPCREAVR